MQTFSMKDVRKYSALDRVIVMTNSLKNGFITLNAIKELNNLFSVELAIYLRFIFK